MQDSNEQQRADRDRDASRIADELAGADIGTDPFVAAVRATRMPMIVTDPRLDDNPVVFVNDAFTRLTGYARDEILGRNCRFLQGPETDADTIARIHDAVDRREAIEIEILNYRKDRSTFWNRLLLAPVPDLHGDIAYFFASQLNVTRDRERLSGLESRNATLVDELGRHLAEQREGERALRFTLASAGLGAWSLERDGMTLTCSSACRAVFGRGGGDRFDYADLIGSVDRASRPELEAAIARALDAGEEFELDFRVAAQDGASRWVGMRGRAVEDGGQRVRLHGVTIDLTRRHRLDRIRDRTLSFVDRVRDAGDPDDIMLAATETIATALDVDRVGYCIIDEDAETLHVQREWTREGFAASTPTHHLADYGRHIDDLNRGEMVRVRDAREDDPHGSPNDPGLSPARAFMVAPIREHGGVVALLYVDHREAREWQDDEASFVRDIAERTRIAVERRRAERRLAAFANSLEQQVAERTDALMQAEAALRQSQKMEAIGQLTGGVAHDFNNLLTVIRSSVELLGRPDVRPERHARYLGAISETVDRAAKLTGQLLAFARRQALKPEPFDVARAVDAVADIVRTLAGSRVEVAIEADADPCFAIADAAQFDTAIVNIAANARDAMEAEGRLVIAARPVDGVPALRDHAAIPGRFVAVSVTDSGPGIDAALIPRIFEPFFTTKGVGRGTGLGLSQVFGFAKQSEGEVRVESVAGQGATFTLYLPATDPPAKAASPQAGGVDRDGPPSSFTVLIVEDNEPVGRTTRRALADRGHRAILAPDAETALGLLNGTGGGFDIVFSDVMMPGMDGIDLAREIGRRHPHMPVVLTSGFSEVLAEGGAHEFALVQKPYTIDMVAAALHRAVAGAVSAAGGDRPAQ